MSRWLAYAGGAGILASAGMVALDVAARALFGEVPLRSFEISTYVFAIATAFGFAYALFERKHIRIDVVYVRFPAPVRRVLDLVSLVALGLMAAGLAHQGVITALDSRAIGATSATTLQTPLYIPQAAWAAGLIWFAAACLALFLRSLWYVLTRRSNEVEARIGLGQGGAEL